MKDELSTIPSRIENGTSQERIAALDEFESQFSAVVAAAAKALVADGDVRMFVADRIMRLAHVVHRAMLSLVVDVADSETRFLRALVLCQFGDRSELPFLLSVASGSDLYRYDAMRQLANLRVPEVQEVILTRLREIDLSQADEISGLLHAWRLFDIPLPKDVRERLSGDDIPQGVRVALAALEL